MAEKPQRVKMAWSDDLSYNSEEEREKERLANAELGEVESPDKPSYLEDELNRLIGYVKQMTTLYGLWDDDWNVDCTDVITTFFMEPKNPILTIFFDDETLTAMLGIPCTQVYDLTYFLREPDMIFTVDGFHDEVTFGTFVESVEGSLLKMLELVYAPIFFSATNWPESVKSEFCIQLHMFLAKLTNFYYKMQGLTVIYVPREGLHMTVEEASVKKEYVQRLEEVVVYWTHRLKSCIQDDTNNAQIILLCPSDQINFWIYRHQCLVGVQYQFENPNVKRIIDILINTHSSYIKQFQKLCKEVEECIIESKSNIEYLQLIKEPCAELENAAGPVEIPKYISKILNTFRYIWMNSPFYNTSDKLTNLFNSLSNQVIIQCSTSISLKSLFLGKTRKAMEAFRKCIECCQEYREIYDAVADTHNHLNPGTWDLDTDIIFNNINAFVQRCVDMLDVCNGMIIFGRIDEEEKISMPRFSGTRGEEFEKACEKIEKIFKGALTKIEQKQDSILNVHNINWYNSILEFRHSLHHIEVLIENLVNTVFITVNNVEEGIRVLCAMYYYAKRVNLKRIFGEKTTAVWNIFGKEIEDIKQSMVDERNRHPARSPTFSGQAIILFIRKNRLAYIKKIMDSALWMMNCSNSADLLYQYEILVQAIEVTIKSTWTSWTETVDLNILEGLNRTLVCESLSKKLLLECNIDRNILALYGECWHWQNIDWEILANAKEIFVKGKDLIYVYESILMIVKGYNRIIIYLSEEERELFKPLIDDCKKIIQPGISEIKWSFGIMDTYITSCLKSIQELQEFLDCYKLCNHHIVRVLEKICDTPLIEFKVYDVFELENFQKTLKGIMNEALQSLLSLYKEIITYLVIVYEGFEKHIDKIPIPWLRYIKHYDMLLEVALLRTVKTSMFNMLNIVTGDVSVGPLPLIKMRIVLIIMNIEFIPVHEDIFTTFSGVLPSILELIDAIPRLYEKFILPSDGLNRFCKVVEDDDDIRQIQESITEEVSVALQMVTTNANTWLQFKHIWEINKKEFMIQYISQNPTAKDFDNDITRYINLAQEIQERETNVQVHILQLNYVSLRASIIKHCIEWQQIFVDYLKEVARRDIAAVYTYIEKSSKAAMRQPTNLVELQVSMDTYEKLHGETSMKESEFPPIKDLMNTLDKLEVEHLEDLKTSLGNIEPAWVEYLLLLERARKNLNANVEYFKNDLLNQAEVFKENATTLMDDFFATVPKSHELTSAEALAMLKSTRAKLKKMRDAESKIKNGLDMFNLSLPVNLELLAIEKELEKLEEVWDMVNKWETAWDTYKNGSFWTLETEEIEETVLNLFRTFNRLSRQLKDKEWSIIDFTRAKVDAFRRTIPLLGDLKNPSMRERHWDRIRVLMNSDFDQYSPDFNLESIIALNFQAYSDEISEISTAATMELNIENGLKVITDIWATTMYEMEYHRDNIYRIKNVDEVCQFLEDHQVLLSSMKSTKYVEPFIVEVEYWEKSLGYVAESIEVALQVQRRWLYLENIFFGEDIRKQLPSESKKFDALSAEWRDITSSMYKGKNAIEACFYKPSPFLLNKLNKIIDDLEGIQRTLEKYLETKRMLFPRFYFISNDDLLEILGNSKKPLLIQTHLKKLFDNLNKMYIDKNAAGVPIAKGMISEDGEMVEWKIPVILDGPAEVWLNMLEQSMRAILKVVLLQTRAALKKVGVQREKWINDWPGQLGITCSKMMWTGDCIRHLSLCRLAGERKPMKKLRKKQNRILQILLVMSRKDIPKMLRLKVNALAVIEIHSRDVVDKLYRLNCIDITSFDWFSQLKFFWDNDKDDCIIRQTNTMSFYTYEYIGNSGRLVITPLTDRCYITLTTALNLFRGGSPQGPAGTGKTETVKDLGRALARWVVVTNCSDGLDYKSMAKCYAGIAQSGCWGCFDEFNRINIEVLSVVAQQILSVLLAMSQGLKVFVFEGVEIKLVNSCGIFITMNPGYAGRTELPDNLKSMFRPISMCVPDNLIIAENTLFSDGFQEYKSAAKKVFTLYELAKRQLSKQDHYDFGLRSMVALLRYAGVKRRTLIHLPEMEIVILAMRDMNTARLTAKDVPLFDGIIKDIFPDSSSPMVDYEMIHNAISAEMRLVGLQPIATGLLKVVQVMETKNSRHSTMVLGDTNTAKSVTWKMLMNTLTRLKREKQPGFELVRYYPINPKALNLAELYGEYNLATGEWTDGVISSVMRTICQEETPDQKWIVFDGPVDAVWIENLNSVMDDNKLLTLINSERISMPSMVSLLFEARDLSVASPATVSRCGMVYNDYKDWGWWPFVNSWLDTLKDAKYRDDLRNIFSYFLQRTLEFKRLHMLEGAGVEGQELTGVRSLCRLLYVMAPNPPPLLGQENDEDLTETLNKMWFLFCLVWSVCATLEEASRKKFDNWLRELEGIFPIKGTVYDYYVDPQRRNFVPWEDKLSDSWKYNPESGFHSILVPTVESYRVQYLSILLIKAGYGVLLGGPSGTGKTSVMQGVINNFDPSVFSNLIMNISAQTTSANVQDMIEARLEKRSKGNYVPSGGKKMVSFMDDMNMPARDEYGSQPPLEFIRQWLDYGFWYDRLKQWKKNVKDMVIVGAVGPPGGARSPLPPRLLSCFHSFYLPAPTHPQLVKIFGTMIAQHFVEFDEETKSAGKILLLATVDIFNIVVAKLLPTPTKMHYLFNLRDISKIFQGLLRSNKDYQNTKNAILRLWVHETYRVFYDRLIDEIDRSWFTDLLNDMIGKHFDSTLHSVCPEKRSPVFGDFINPFKVYEDIPSMEVLRNYIERQLEEYNCSAGVVRMDLVLFKYAIEHVAKIVRVISQPRGNMLLVGIGGSGRQSLTRLASYICEYNTFQVVVTKNYGIKDFREDLKGLYTSTGVDNKRTTFIFSDTQIAEESFTEVINNLLSSGEITNLFKPDEFEDIKNNLEKPMKNANVLQTQENTYLFLVNRVRGNLHIVVCMSPIGDAFRSRLRQYPALISCTTIDWFLEWPREALLEVAYKFLTGLDLVVSITGEKMKSIDFTGINRLKNSVASVMSLMQSSVSQYSIKMFQESKRTNYVTPTNYLELVSGYKDTLTMKRTEIASSANKLRNGLSKLEETRISVESMSSELEIAKEQVALFTAQCLEYMGVINVQQQNADEQQKSVAIKSKKTGEEEVVCKKLADAAMKDLAGAMPALEEAVAALDALNKKDITEIKSYAKPPATIQLVLEAVMILLKAPTSWTDTKRVIGDQYFLEKLRNFDKDHIPEKVLTKIRTYTKNPEFEPEKVGTVSLAAKSLCLWVRAIEKYGLAYKIVKPKKEKLDEALGSLAIKQQILAEAQAKLKDLSEMLERLQAEYDEKLETKEELARKAIALQAKLDRAAALLDGLGGEKDRWESTVKDLDGKFLNLPGDCLIATAFISYLGPFGSDLREQLMNVWINEVAQEEIPHSPELSIKSFLLNDALLREWNLWGLPGDAFSAENGIIVTNATRWPLAVDPQGQALIWISNMEHKNGIKVIEAGQPEYLKVLEQSLIKGKPVLIQNVYEILDPSIEPILTKALVYIGNRVMIKFNQMVIDFNPNFRLYLTTKLGNPTYTPEVLTKTTMVNFAVKEQGLQAQLLGIVVRKEVPQLEHMKDNLVVNIAKNKKILVDLENELLRLMNESEGSLLENEELFITLQISKKTSVDVKEALQTSQVTEVEIDTARQAYVPVAERASVLFFVLNDLSLIDPMYQFSLEAYIDVFLFSINRSEKTPVLEDRITNLNEYHTYSVYKNTCRALFEMHKLVFAFHMLAKIMNQKGQLSMIEYQFLLKGGIVLDRAQQPENPTNWLPEDCWDNMTEMNKLPGFHGVIDTFETYSRDWQAWYLHPEPETQPLIGEWNGICNDFQRLLFVRSLRLDRLTSCITTFISNIMGPRYVEPPVLDIKAAWEESQSKTPLLFVLSPGVDPTSALIQLAIDCKMFDKFQSLSLGQGQSAIAERFLAAGMEDGGWVFLANCHLACAWLGTLRGLDAPTVHNKFRLWLSSMPDPSFPLGILQKSIKMTTEPPQGLKGNMAILFANLNETKFDEASDKYRKLLFCVSFFHCTLIARKRFRQLGYNVVYSFNNADFDASENLLTIYLNEYEEVPWDTLKYLFAVINYGGHITDDWDMRVLLAYINQIFCPDALEVENFRLSPVTAYNIPVDGSLLSYRDHIDMLPTLERAESVGQHSSADVACQAQDASFMCDSLLSLVATGGGADDSGKDEKVNTLAIEMISKLPHIIDIETTEKLMGAEAVMPLCVSLTQELVYFNDIIKYIMNGLKELKKAIAGLVVMSEELEVMYQCLFEGKVPPPWIKARPSVKPLGSWCRELSARGAHLAAWAAAPRVSPTLCWLPAFNTPTGFLTAVMQTTARKECWPIDTLCWEFTVYSVEESAFVRPPADGGVYIRGLYLEGASWFKKEMYLIEPLAMQLVFPMSPIHFKPIQMGGRRMRSINFLNKYTCPAYYYPLRKGAFVVGVDLSAGKQDSNFWIKRGTALLCTLGT